MTAAIFMYVPGKEWLLTSHTGSELDIKKAAERFAVTHGEGKWSEIRVYLEDPAFRGRPGRIVWVNV